MPASRQHPIVEQANQRLQLPVPTFALEQRDRVIEQLLQEPNVAAYIDSAAEGDSTKRSELIGQAREYAREIGPKFSPRFYFRVGYHLARTLVRLHFRVRAVAVEDAAFDSISPDTTVILYSNHRSNFDPLVITYLASRRSTVTLSAGEWARMWPLHHLIRAAGGFVVNRDAEDPLYMQVLSAYVRLTAANGMHQLFFPEGALSQDGRAGKPKLGFLGFYCRAAGERREIAFVPVGLNYDRVPEDRKLVNASGTFENPGVAFMILTSLRFVWSTITLPFRRRSHRYGNACVSFGRPFQLREWLKKHDIASSTLSAPDRLPWLPQLADELMRHCEREIPSTPATIVASLFCSESTDKVWTHSELRDRASALVAKLNEDLRRVCWPGDDDTVFGEALDLLRFNKLVERAGDNRYRAATHERRVLQYYANSIEHLLT